MDITSELTSKDRSRTYITCPISFWFKCLFPIRPQVTYMVHVCQIYHSPSSVVVKCTSSDDYKFWVFRLLVQPWLYADVLFCFTYQSYPQQLAVDSSTMYQQLLVVVPLHLLQLLCLVHYTLQQVPVTKITASTETMAIHELLFV